MINNKIKHINNNILKIVAKYDFSFPDSETATVLLKVNPKNNNKTFEIILKSKSKKTENDIMKHPFYSTVILPWINNSQDREQDSKNINNVKQNINNVIYYDFNKKK